MSSPPNHEYRLDTARSKVHVNLFPDAQMLQVDAGSSILTVDTEIKKGELYIRLRENDRQVLDASLQSLIQELELVKALKAVRSHLSLQDIQNPTPDVQAALKAIQVFLGKV